MTNNKSAFVTLDPDLLPDYQQWRRAQNHEFTLWNYLDIHGTIELAVIFSKLFWPDFIKVDGYVFLNEHYDAGLFEQWKEQLSEDRRAIESVINEVHLYDLFNNKDEVQYDIALYEYLARVLMTCWQHALREQFPQAHFQFAYATEPEEYGPTITFFQTDG